MSSSKEQDHADYWIKKLGLYPHPGLETGYLNEVYRDEHLVTGTSGKPRSSSTNIYFLHKKADPFNDETVFFRMRNMELLNFYRGHPLKILWMPDPTKPDIETKWLGPDPEQGHCYFLSIPRDRWFVRRLESDDIDAFTLIGCSVVPGYDPEDIETKTYQEIKRELD